MMSSETSPLPWGYHKHYTGYVIHTKHDPEGKNGGNKTVLEADSTLEDIVLPSSADAQHIVKAVNAYPELAAENRRLREALEKTLTVATKLRNEMGDLTEVVRLLAGKHPKDVDAIFESDSGFTVYTHTTNDFLNEEFDEAEKTAQAALEGGANV